MIRRFNQLVDWCIPDNLKSTAYILRKAKVLTYIHLFSLVIGGLLFIISSTIIPENNLPLLPGIVLLLGFIYIFKRWGNLNLSGNLLSLVWALTLIPSVFETGGIFSDNLLWLMIAPLLAFLFSTRLSGILWSIALLTLTTYCYILDIQAVGAYRDQTYEFDSTYYFASYFFLFIAVLGIIVIFKKGKEDMISLLQEQREQMRQQKQEIVAQSEELKKVESALRATNRELEHFAYAASHDLKEPLRMISSYTLLIKKRLANSNNLDAISGEYMNFVTDGATRMQRLLDDLLEYSRLGRKMQKRKINNLNDILMIVMSNLMAQMSESQTAICSTQLPSVYSSSTEMMQLFQNIISNAIKFRKQEVKPVISINAVDVDEQFYRISIADNGIGIPDEHRDRVFAIFERLHSKTEYEGTGIGLATCKKIVNNMGGKIWLDSQYGKGTTFFFTVPKSLSGDENLN
ncbi:MAG: ATP-binding protein [Bacteroidota bacterium]